MNLSHPADVRALIAERMIGATLGEGSLGAVSLHDHQRDAVARVRRLLAAHRGALLADDVGLGKTFVALAVARDAARPLVVAPAALRDAWLASAEAANVRPAFASVQSLSRTTPRGGPFDVVIVDEAHHLRSTRTRRFRTAVDLCRDARVLLLTATPIQNRVHDLRAVLSLFLGQHAFSLDGADLSAFVVRRLESDLTRTARPSLPRVNEPVFLPAPDDTDCLDRIVSLPAPLPPRGGGDGGVLLTYSLVRQWSSSRAALIGALRRRLARARAMEDALAAGRRPTAGELAAWCAADDAQQLAFPELVIQEAETDTQALLERVRNHARAVTDLLAWLRATTDPDIARVIALRELRATHSPARIVAFSEYTDTVTKLYSLMALDPRVAVMTHAGARVAGGRLPTRELLRQFGPGAMVSRGERVDLLLTTDLLSEGVNLQAASVVVHLDLAWNPARMEQRVGRLRRIGADGDRIDVYVMPPPASAERLLRLEQRLRAKLGVAAATLGASGAILPKLGVSPECAGPRHHEWLATALSGWRGHTRVGPPAGAAVQSAVAGALACVESDGRHLLVAVTDACVTDAPDDVLRLVNGAGGDTGFFDVACGATAERRVLEWLTRREVTSVVSIPDIRLARSRRTVLHRVDAIVRRTPRHAQPRLAPLMRAARSAAGATLSAGAERVLDELAASAMDDDAWLHAMREFAQLHARPDRSSRVVALLLLVPPR